MLSPDPHPGGGDFHLATGNYAWTLTWPPVTTSNRPPARPFNWPLTQEQLEVRPSLPGLQARQGADGNLRHRGEIAQRHVALLGQRARPRSRARPLAAARAQN